MEDKTDKQIGFQALCEMMEDTGGAWQAHIPSYWKQGRTAYGGLSAGLLLAATQKDHVDLPPLRSALINFVGPITDDPRMSSRVLRQGRNVTSVQAEATIGDQIVCSSNFVFGSSRESELAVTYPAPNAPAPADCEDFTPEFARDFVPVFFHQFETKLIAGARPMTGAKEGYIRTWSRHKDPASREAMDSLLCLGDVLPPAALPIFSKMGAVTSITWMFNVLTDNPQTKDGWWHVETKLTAGNSGYSSQVMRIWNSEGDLVVDGMQSVALFI